MFLETLPADARALLTRIGGRPRLRDFYLAGGSAAALHLGHRVSVDLDFFTTDPAFEPESLVQELTTLGRLEVQQGGPGTFIGKISDVRISFFTYPYPLLQPPAAVEGVAIARPLDLALMKVIAIGQRGKKRDFIDLFFLCRSGMDLEDLMRRVPEKYRTLSYPAYHLIRALAFFADAEADPAPKMLVPFDWGEVKAFFGAEATRLLSRL